jgi:hypothetical protein
MAQDVKQEHQTLKGKRNPFFLSHILLLKSVGILARREPDLVSCSLGVVGISSGMLVNLLQTGVTTTHKRHSSSSFKLLGEFLELKWWRSSLMSIFSL